jgi:hypothetical protein
LVTADVAVTLALGDETLGLALGDETLGLALGDETLGLALGDETVGLALGDETLGLCPAEALVLRVNEMLPTALLTALPQPATMHPRARIAVNRTRPRVKRRMPGPSLVPV